MEHSRKSLLKWRRRDRWPHKRDVVGVEVGSLIQAFIKVYVSKRKVISVSDGSPTGQQSRLSNRSRGPSIHGGASAKYQTPSTGSNDKQVDESG